MPIPCYVGMVISQEQKEEGLDQNIALLKGVLYRINMAATLSCQLITILNNFEW